MKRIAALALAVLAFSTPALADAPSNADKITDFAIDKLNAVFDGVSKAMPTVAKYALEVTSINCLIAVIQDFLLLLIPLAFAIVARTCWQNKRAEEYSDWEIPAIIATVLAFLCGIGVIINIVGDMWKFIGIFHPDLYLIHMALQKVTG